MQRHAGCERGAAMRRVFFELDDVEIGEKSLTVREKESAARAANDGLRSQNAAGATRPCGTAAPERDGDLVI